MVADNTSHPAQLVVTLEHLRLAEMREDPYNAGPCVGEQPSTATATTAAARFKLTFELSALKGRCDHNPSRRL